MIFRAHTPAFPLNDFVEHFVYFEGLSAAHNLDRFLPDGNTEILIDLSEHPQHIHDNETLEIIQTCREAWVSGVRTQPITIPSGTGSRMLIVAFKKGRAFPFYSFPVSELTDTVVSADLIFGRAILDLREQLLSAPSIRRMFHLLEAFLLQQAGDSLYDDHFTRCIQYALLSIIHKPTAQRLHQLSDEIGYSQKHFIDLFKQQVGISPKQYMKIMRFQKAIGTIENQAAIDWGQIALESGFYDQAHFIHDFRHFSGFTPNKYLQKKVALLNYIPVA